MAKKFDMKFNLLLFKTLLFAAKSFFAVSLLNLYRKFGASANITGIGILRKEGHEVSNGDFFKIGIPFTLSAIVPAYILIWILFGV
mgnify:FL=1